MYGPGFVVSNTAAAPFVGVDYLNYTSSAKSLTLIYKIIIYKKYIKWKIFDSSY